MLLGRSLAAKWRLVALRTANCWPSEDREADLALFGERSVLKLRSRVMNLCNIYGISVGAATTSPCMRLSAAAYSSWQVLTSADRLTVSLVFSLRRGGPAEAGVNC